MPDESILSDDFVRQLSAVGEVDLLVGIPTLNNRGTVQHVLGAVKAGLAAHFPRERSVVVIPDGGSRDGTVDAVKEASRAEFKNPFPYSSFRTSHIICTRYHSLLGQGGALRMILAAADLLHAGACALIAPDLESITPEWISALLRPVRKDSFDFVLPIYQRHRLDGLLIKNVLSPLIQTAYGYRVEEPVGGVFGFSSNLACRYLEQDVWHEDLIRFAADLGMVTTAMAGGFRLCQSYLGPKTRRSKQAGRDLSGAIQQVVGALFRSLEIHQAYWTGRGAPNDAPVFGVVTSGELEPAHANPKPMMRMFRSGVDELTSILQKILVPATLESLREITKLGDQEFRFPDELWAKTVFEFASAYHHPSINRDHILQALTPLYRGRIGAFLRENEGAGSDTVAEKLEALHRQFEDLRPYLVERWSAEERGELWDTSS